MLFIGQLREFNFQDFFNRIACILAFWVPDLQNFLRSGPTMVSPKNILSNWDASVTVDENGIRHLTISCEFYSGKTCTISGIFSGKLGCIIVLIWSESQTLYCLLHSQPSLVKIRLTTTQVSYSIVIFQFTILTCKYPKHLCLKRF